MSPEATRPGCAVSLCIFRRLDLLIYNRVVRFHPLSASLDQVTGFKTEMADTVSGIPALLRSTGPSGGYGSMKSPA